jgi:4-amino-4-deoxy-L-arabinose transferase-like glycosyltransferase
MTSQTFVPSTHTSFASPLALAVIAAVALSLFLWLGHSPLFDVDEGAFSEATLEMFQRGDFLSTYLNGEPRYDKPILIYWLQAASVALFGVSELSFRLPSALCAAAWVALTFAFARRRFGMERALLAAGIMGTSLGVHVIGRAATADALLNMLIAASLYAAWIHLETGRRLWLYAAFTAIALGVLAKGPVAILIPLAVTFVFCWLRRDLRLWLRTVFDLRGLCLFAVIALPWYAIILYKEGAGFVQGFFIKHNVSRFSGPLQGHAGSLFYYVPVLLAATLPFAALLVSVLLRIRQVWRDDLQCYLLLWFAFVFLFFSVSGTKLPHYVLYGMSGMFVLMALYVPVSRFWTLAPAALWFVFLLALPSIAQWARPHVADAYYREAVADVQSRFGTAYYLYAAVGLIVTAVFMLDRRVSLTLKLIVSGAFFVAGLAVFLVPIGAAVQQEPIRQAALLARERGWTVITWRLNAPSFSVYYGKPTPSREPEPGDWVLTKAKRLQELQGLRADVVYAKNGIVLARIY